MDARVPPGCPGTVFRSSTGLPLENGGVPIEAEAVAERTQDWFWIGLEAVAAHDHGRIAFGFHSLGEFHLVHVAQVAHQWPVDVGPIGGHDCRGIPEEDDMPVGLKGHPGKAKRVVRDVLVEEDTVPGFLL